MILVSVDCTLGSHNVIKKIEDLRSIPYLLSPDCYFSGQLFYRRYSLEGSIFSPSNHVRKTVRVVHLTFNVHEHF